MAKAQNKTQVTAVPVDDFLASVEPEKRRTDAIVVNALMARVTGERPKMWGPSIIGFGDHHYKYESGREGDYFQVGFAPRKANLVLYVMPGATAYPEHLARLGKHTTGKGCLYINKLDDIDLGVLEDMIRQSVADGRKRPG